MPRYALKIEYHGAPFAGWQKQAHSPSVQSALEAALRKLDPEVGKVAAAGRTDAGVHAIGQVAHCDLTKEFNPFRLGEALNFHLKPTPIAIVAAAAVADDWHARFSATQRGYLYRVIQRRAPLTYDAGRAWQVSRPLDIGLMQTAASHLLGHHDFTTFRATMCQAKSPMKTLDEASIIASEGRWGREIQFTFRARSFLHNQIRSFVGSLERVGAGRWTPQDLKDALEAKDRGRCGPVAPPEGLYLSDVRYAENPFSPEITD